MEDERRDEGFPILTILIVVVALVVGGGGFFFVYRARQARQREAAEAFQRALQMSTKYRNVQIQQPPQAKQPDPAPKAEPKAEKADTPK